jgi:hypothetical protein
MMAKEMNHLSVEEREKVLEDVHGIARVVEEPEEFIEACLALLEKELDNISSKMAYDLARSMSEEYTCSKKIRLMFLRAESFDPYNAASCMVRFFDEKCELFGADKLTKDITLDDLDPYDIMTIESGFLQMLPEKNCAGRKVFCIFPKLKGVRTAQNIVSYDVIMKQDDYIWSLSVGAHLFRFQLRAGYYLMMRSVEKDEDVQKRGVVGCAYNVVSGLNFDVQLVRKWGRLRNVLPLRFDSAHVCYNDQRVVPVVSLAIFIMQTHTRVRLRTHYGSDMECQIQLSSFGIPISALPVSPRGEFNLKNHRAFVATQRAIEATTFKGKGPLGVAQKPEEKASSIQPIFEEKVVVAAPHPDLNGPTGYERLMSFSNLGFSNPLCSVVGAPNLLPRVPPQSQLPVVPQSHIAAPTSVSRSQAKIYESPAKPYVIYDPLPNDVLLGRGKAIQQRPGNIRYREMVEKQMDRYDEGDRGAKYTVTASIVYLLKEEGGRFLKELEDGSWAEVDEATALLKTSHTFRTRRKVLQAIPKKGKSTAW